MIADINEVPQTSAQVALPFLVRHLAYTSMEFDLGSDTYSLRNCQHTGDGLGKRLQMLTKPDKRPRHITQPKRANTESSNVVCCVFLGEDLSCTQIYEFLVASVKFCRRVMQCPDRTNCCCQKRRACANTGEGIVIYQDSVEEVIEPLTVDAKERLGVFQRDNAACDKV